jgi:hypothetical protein
MKAGLPLSLAFVIALSLPDSLHARQTAPSLIIPSIYTHIELNETGQLIAVTADGKRLALRSEAPSYTIKQMSGNIQGVDDGFVITFTDPDHNLTLKGGLVFFALIDTKQRLGKAMFRPTAKIDDQGRARFNIVKELSGEKDFIDWGSTGHGHIYYRVQAPSGELVYDGMFAFHADSPKGPFHVLKGSLETGPFVEKVTLDSATISFSTRETVKGKVEVDGHGSVETGEGQFHTAEINGLKPATQYSYRVTTADDMLSGTFTTAPSKGNRQPFTFAFGSDSRAGIDSGERHEQGVNQYILQRAMALTLQQKASFLQFTGDMINGYNNSVGVQQFQFDGWKKAVMPFAAHLPMFTAPGNHEVVLYTFDDGTKDGVEIERFPFDTDGSEAVFRSRFHNFDNGPKSEDGSELDPNPNQVDFPDYAQTAYKYTWGNVGMVVLNSDYLYSPYLSDTGDSRFGGNIHGYIMDNQAQWMKDTLKNFEQDSNIDHVFVTFHTPMFPNGGHVQDDMFYNGDNSPRPVIAGKPAKLGIIERRDELLRSVLDSKKVVAILTGDEHNYSRLLVQPGMPLYAESGFVPANPVQITREFHHITNGATGAPYYALQNAPWHEGYDRKTGTGPYLKKFTTRFAVNFFHVDGKSIRMTVIDPQTLELIEEVTLR